MKSMETICNIGNSIMHGAYYDDIKEAVLSGSIKQYTSIISSLEIEWSHNWRCPIIDSEVISEKMIEEYDSRDYEHIYNQGKCPLKLRKGIEYLRLYIQDKDVDGYVAFKIVSRHFTPKLGPDNTPYRYNFDKLEHEKEPNPDGLFCDWLIEYELGEEVERVLSRPKKSLRMTSFAKRVEEVVKAFYSLPDNPSKKEVRSLINKLEVLIDRAESIHYKLEDLRAELSKFERKYES